MENRSKLSFIFSGLRGSRGVSPQLWKVLLLQAAFFALLILWAPMALAAPSTPSQSSKVGDLVTNPVTGKTTLVSALIVDPTGTPTAGTTAFVQTSDGYTFLVKSVGGVIYNGATTPLEFTIKSKDTTNQTVSLAQVNGSKSETIGYQVDTLLNTAASTAVNDFLNPPSSGAPPATAPQVISGQGGYRDNTRTGINGSNGGYNSWQGHPGEAGGDGPPIPYTNTTVRSTTNQIGIWIGSTGGNGGDGGKSIRRGGSGGAGGTGGDVTVTNSTGIQVATTGDNNYGIFAFSRSGEAGNGGSGTFVGGKGGYSSDGGNVSVTNNGIVITKGEGAYGIYGLSVSNKAGNGGDSWGSVGNGGVGGSGGSVDVINNSTGGIYTSGDYAHGILAQSIGGSGGSAGNSGDFLISLNGSADVGGNGSYASAENYGRIVTTGNYARGIFAESIGGGGGSGGSSGGLISLGGCGSGGGSGGFVSVTNFSSGTISTGTVTTDSSGNTTITGAGSDGIFAQSVGGSGGSGSNTSGLISLGGNGSNGGNGGPAYVWNYGNISTVGDKARGIVVQSIGGGGGDGGNSNGFVSVGGRASDGGDGFQVIIENTGNVTTRGDDAMGILAQSVGGGGGNGGSSGSVTGNFGVAVGGSGAAGGAGGEVDVTLQGKDANTAAVIHTEGDRSTGLFAQSVGGGGGNGGGAVQMSIGAGAAVSVAVGGQGGKGGPGGGVYMGDEKGPSIVETDGNDAAGIFLQSVGGGGGNGGYALSAAASAGPAAGALSFALGGNGGSAGAGGTVGVGIISAPASGTQVAPGFVNWGGSCFNGGILTRGDRSLGFVAQSVGGGGGNGGLAVSAAASASLEFSGSIGVGIGGAGAGGGAGGDVSAGIQGNITTEGADSTGLLAQSVGGGGGNGGGAIAAGLALAKDSAAVSVGVGGSAGTGSDGGTVTLATRSGTVTTQGDNSTGIIVQSVGGGGGNGGYSVSAGLAAGAESAGSVNVGLGGSGKGGGNGGAVYADLQSDVTTSSVLIAQSVDPETGATVAAHFGQNSPGIVVQSVGGGGGNGGFNVSAGAAAAGEYGGTVTVGLGGNGAKGGNGGTVEASSTGNISTQGDSSAGFAAQSIGGGGGNGGYNVSVGAAAAGKFSGAVNVGLGGSGKGGGNGGDVEAVSSGNISTQGYSSAGIVAQSIGGGGGNGGYNVSVGAAGAKEYSGAVTVGLGGNGGSGGTGGTARAISTGNISTQGDSSPGIVSQTIGGGGGNGGFNFTGGLSGAKEYSGSISVGLGGKGGKGANAGVAFVTATGSIETRGSYSDGILAQAIGGGGGNGGSSWGASGSPGAVTVSVGGSGKEGGIGGCVEVELDNSKSSVITYGANSSGISAQSVGGGGGSGGSSQTFNLAGVIPDNKTTFSANVSVGGGSGAGGYGCEVDLKNSGSVATEGSGSDGIFAQSVGGGGGSGGDSSSVTLAMNCENKASVSVGGSGASGGYGGYVNVENSGDIATKGAESSGIFAQSVGGGGGSGGDSTTAGVDLVIPTSKEELLPKPTVTATVSVGGSGGTGGDGLSVTVDNSGSIATGGDLASGILAQSVGGGGGVGGQVHSFDIGISANPKDYVPGMDLMNFSADFKLGGDGGNGGNGDQVTVTNDNSILTTGACSHGIIAQSVGGGGGAGGDIVKYDLNSTDIAPGDKTSVLNEVLDATHLSSELEGGQGGDGYGSSVDVNNKGAIETKGAFSYGILAQSIGGGGGFAAVVNTNGTTTTSFAPNVPGVLTQTDGTGATFAGSLGGEGSAGKVTVADSGSITTLGQGSDGIFAQSAGGNTAGDVSVTADGDITTYGTDSYGIFTQSKGGAGNGNISVTVNGTVTGGSGSGGGVCLMDGVDNELDNNGVITTVSGAAGLAILGTTGDDQINNEGRVTGSVDLGSGANSFYNGQKAVFSPGGTVNLGAGNLLTNEGVLSPGGSGNATTTNLTGNYTQTATGVYQADLDLKNHTADCIKISGAANLSGRVTIDLVNAGFAQPGTYSDPLLSVAGTLTRKDLTLVLPQDTDVASYWLINEKDPGINLDYKVDYAPSGLTPDEQSVGAALDSIELAQTSPGLSPIVDALFFQPTAAALGGAYDSLSGEGVSASEQTGFEANDLFLSSIAHRMAYWISGDPNDPVGRALRGDKDLLYARQTVGQDPVSGGAGAPPVAERTWRVWMSGYGGVASYNGNAGADSAQADLDGEGFAMGIDDQVLPNALVGLAGGSGYFSFDVPGRQTSGNVDPWHMAGYAAVRRGCFYAIGALAYDHFSNHENRHASIPAAGTSAGIDENLSGDFSAYSVSGYLEAGYNYLIDRFTVTPFAALEFGVLHMAGFSESGDLGLSYAPRTASSLPTLFGLQWKDDFTLTRSAVLTTLVRAAWMHEFDTDRSIDASFVEAPGFDFVVQGAQPPSDSLRSGVGFSLSLSHNCALYANFDSDFSGTGYSYSGTGGFRYTW